MATQVAAADSRSKKGWMEIEIQLGSDNEDTHVFIGGSDEGDMRIKRGVKVIVPPSVVERLDLAVKGTFEPDPNDSEKHIVVDRKRFAYSVSRVL